MGINTIHSYKKNINISNETKDILLQIYGKWDHKQHNNSVKDEISTSIYQH